MKRTIGYKIIIAILLCGFITTHCRRKDNLQKGVEAIEKGQYEKALKSLRVSLTNDSLNPEIHFNISLAYAHIDSIEQACRHYYTLYAIDSTRAADIRLKEMLARSLDLNPFHPQRIPMKKMNQFKGVFSPDAKSLVVAAARSDVANIYLIQPDGRIIRQITKRGMNTDPDFSPTGEYIAFASDADGDDDIYLYHIENKEIVNLTDNTAKDFSPSFSPDGNELVFISNMDHEYKWEVYRMNLKNKHVKRLTKNNYWDGFPKFTPDGKHIIFSSKRNHSEDIYIMDKNGGGEKTFYATESDENDPLIRGHYLYFKSNRSGEWVIYRYNTETEEIIELTDDSYPTWNPRISPDGSRLALTRKIRNRWRLYYLNLASGIPASHIIQKIEDTYDVVTEPDEKEK